MKLIALVSLLLISGPCLAADLLSIDVEHDGGVYRMTSVTWFNAPRLGVFDVLTDYDQFDRISSVYKDSHFKPAAADGTPRVFTELKGCVLFFCQTMRRTERLENTGLQAIRAITEPDLSDFKSSTADWTLTDDNGGTRVVYAIEMEPSFWVPPLLGPYVMKRKLRKGGADAIDRIELLAQASKATTDTLKARGLSGFDQP